MTTGDQCNRALVDPDRAIGSHPIWTSSRYRVSRRG
jgi:hypothetical protein